MKESIVYLYDTLNHYQWINSISVTVYAPKDVEGLNQQWHTVFINYDGQVESFHSVDVAICWIKSKDKKRG